LSVIAAYWVARAGFLGLLKIEIGGIKLARCPWTSGRRWMTAKPFCFAVSYS
jgi:hypothetical protein